MAIRGAGNVTVTYNSQNVTAYINEFELQQTVDELEQTSLASTVMEYRPSIANYSLSLNGDWALAADNIFGPDIVSPTTRACSIQIEDGASSVTYAWTVGFLTGFSISGSATDKITHAPEIRLSGPPTRTVA